MLINQWKCNYNAVPRYRTGQLDESIVGVMAEHFNLSRQTEAEKLLAWDYGSHTAVYLLLLARLLLGLLILYLLLNVSGAVVIVFCCFNY